MNELRAFFHSKQARHKWDSEPEASVYNRRASTLRTQADKFVELFREVQELGGNNLLMPRRSV
jgi:hypothetical protein